MNEEDMDKQIENKPNKEKAMRKIKIYTEQCNALDECQQIAKKRGGNCLSNVYFNTHTKLEWECAEGHKWMASPSKIKSGRWCPNCANKNRENNSRLTILDMQEIAKKRNGICITEKYKNSKTKIKWQCSEGHQWEAIYDSIRAGKWCPECGRQKSILARTYSIENAQNLAKEYNGKCLSTEYNNNRTKLVWECAEGHHWEANYNSVQNGSWCPECGRKKSGLARRNSIEDAQKLAKERGGKCLSKIYIGATSKLLWECSEGHQWESAYGNIQSGTWCPECDRQKKGLARTVSIEDAQKLAKDRGGKCLSKKYERSNAKLKWRCSEGHQWDATYESIKRGSWCLKCSGKEILTIDEMQEIAKSHNGKCLSKEYKNARNKLKWECSKGHVWYARASHVKFGSWCPFCAGRYLSIEDMQDLARKRGGKCLSKVYESAHAKLQWECKNGHNWKATYANIQRGEWCPECLPYTGEKLCRLAFETLFNSKFPKSYPDWLKTEEKNKLELDGYSENYQIAFEHHGNQHYSFNSWYHKSQYDFINQKKRDLYKKKLCEDHGVLLIEVPQIPEKISLDELVPYIIEELEKKEFQTDRLNYEKPDFDQIYLKDDYNDNYNKLKEIVSEKNGNILSEKYLGSKIKLQFKCKEGHKWKALPSDIKNGSWCPICVKKNRGNNRKLTIEEMQFIAMERGGKCLSTEYINSALKLEWQCNEGHIWQAKYSHIKSGSWCPECASKKRGLSRRLTIEDARKIAQERGGKCLSEKYEVFPNKLLWQCSEGHQWWSTYTNIQSGRWCPKCTK